MYKKFRVMKMKKQYLSVTILCFNMTLMYLFHMFFFTPIISIHTILIRE